MAHGGWPRARGAGFLLALIAVGACGGAPGTERGAASRALAIGEPVPTYNAATLAGDSVRVGVAGAPLTLVNVWATWCTSCREEMADLETLHRDFAPRGLRVVAVSIDAGSAARVRKFVEREGLTFAVVHDPEARIQGSYQVVGVPSTYLVGTDGRLLWRQIGGIHGATKNVRAVVDQALQADAVR
jgi:peroxiredoxin